MAQIDQLTIVTLFEMFWWFSIGLFFVVFVIRMVFNFLNR